MINQREIILNKILIFSFSYDRNFVTSKTIEKQNHKTDFFLLIIIRYIFCANMINYQHMFSLICHLKNWPFLLKIWKTSFQFKINDDILTFQRRNIFLLSLWDAKKTFIQNTIIYYRCAYSVSMLFMANEKRRHYFLS